MDPNAFPCVQYSDGSNLLKGGKMSVKDDTRIVTPTTSITEVNIPAFEVVVKEDRKIYVALLVYTTFKKHLTWRKICLS